MRSKLDFYTYLTEARIEPLLTDPPFNVVQLYLPPIVNVGKKFSAPGFGGQKIAASVEVRPTRYGATLAGNLREIALGALQE